MHGYPVFQSLSDECPVEADVIIDFSTAKAVDGLLNYCAEEKGSGGFVYHRTFRGSVKPCLKEASGQVDAVLRSANMSIGINLLMKIR